MEKKRWNGQRESLLALDPAGGEESTEFPNCKLCWKGGSGIMGSVGGGGVPHFTAAAVTNILLKEAFYLVAATGSLNDSWNQITDHFQDIGGTLGMSPAPFPSRRVRLTWTFFFGSCSFAVYRNARSGQVLMRPLNIKASGDGSNTSAHSRWEQGEALMLCHHAAHTLA